MHFAERELERRADAGLLEPTLRAESAVLEAWVLANHPDAPKLAAKGIENRIRDQYRRFKARGPKTTSDGR